MNGAIAHTSGESPDHRLPRLLLVDPDPSGRESLPGMLAADYRVEATLDGELAWEAVQREPPDLVLANVGTPGLDGVELTRKLRANPHTAAVPIILIAASEDEGMLLQGLDAGADDYLTEPLTRQGLLARLRAHRRLIELRRQTTTHPSDERYRLIVESARDYAIFTYDARQRVTSWNPGAEVITGFTAAEIIGQPIELVFTKEDRAAGIPAFEAQRAEETGHFYNERWHLRKDGSRFWGSGVVMPFHEDEASVGSLKILRDLTASRESERARREAEDRFTLVVQSIRDYAIYMLDPEGNIATWNPGAERLKGFTAEEVIGRHFSICFTPEDITAGKPGHEQAQATSDGQSRAEGWRLRKDGTRFWSDELLAALRGEDGQLVGFALFARDLSERKRHEDERTQLLEAEQVARREAEAANRTKDQFIAALSHELRTPLAPVQMALFLMEQEKGLPASVSEGIQLIRRNVAAEVRLIGDLLDVSRIVHGKLELNRALADVHRCIQEALEVCREDFKAKQLVVNVRLEAKDTLVLSEEARLQQVFWNLFKNAAKFTPPRGRVTVRSSNVDGSIVVEVIDSGIGIATDVLPKIFAPFEQGDPDRVRRFGGLGLGLAIARAIVTAHDGELQAESPGPDQGATFRVRLPRAAKMRNRKAQRSPTTANKRGADSRRKTT